MKTVVVRGFADQSGVSLPTAVEREETFGSGGERKTRATITLLSFRRIDRLDDSLRVGTLDPGSRVKDTIKGTYYEVLGPGRFRQIGDVPKPTSDHPGPESQKGRVLLFTALSGSAFLIFGWNLASKRRSRKVEALGPEVETGGHLGP